MLKIYKLLLNKTNLPILIILIIAAFVRLYDISSFMGFLGDEGRDMIVAREILQGELTLLGPRSSAGDFYMGPFYYYLISPFLLLSNYDPVGPAIMVALLGAATVWLIYYTGLKMFSRTAGLFAAGLYTLSPLVLAYSHSSWNPNVLPFFSLLLMLVLYLTVKKDKGLKFFVLTGFLFGLCLQLHYLSLFLAPAIFAYLVWANFHKYKKKFDFKKISLQLVCIFTGTVLAMSPLIVFEMRHEFLNTRGILNFAGSDDVSYSANNNYFQIAGEVFFRSFARLIFNFPDPTKIELFGEAQIALWSFVTLLCTFLSIAVLLKNKNKYGVYLILTWFASVILLFGLYKKEIHDYLFTVIFAVPFLLTGNLLAYIYDYNFKSYPKNVFRIVSILFFCSLIVLYLFDIPFRYEPNNQRDQVKMIAEFVLEKAEGKSYNFALLSSGNSDHAYRYYFELLGNPPTVLENLEKADRDKTITEQLFVVCEEACQPLGNPLHEIAAYGRAEIAGEWNVSVVKVYKLIPYLPE